MAHHCKFSWPIGIVTMEVFLLEIGKIINIMEKACREPLLGSVVL